MRRQLERLMVPGRTRGTTFFRIKIANAFSLVEGSATLEKAFNASDVDRWTAC